MKNLNPLARYTLSTLALAALSAAGCSSNPKTTSGIPSNSSVTDISPTPPTQAAATITPITEVNAQQPVTSVASNGGANASVGGSTYTVQKGDTLFKIAREHYGEASAWKKIAAANPGAGNMIKPGQKLVLP